MTQKRKHEDIPTWQIFFKTRPGEIVWKELTYNEIDKPIGDTISLYSTFIGVLARWAHLLPSDYQDWRTSDAAKK
jgi:hypothetical protein